MCWLLEQKAALKIDQPVVQDSRLDTKLLLEESVWTLLICRVNLVCPIFSKVMNNSAY